MLTNLLNPKVAVQFFLLGSFYTIITLVWLFTYMVLIDYIRVWLSKPSSQRIFKGVTGAILVGFGIKLAFHSGN